MLGERGYFERIIEKNKNYKELFKEIISKYQKGKFSQAGFQFGYLFRKVIDEYDPSRKK